MIQRTIPITFQHRVSFTHGAFDAKNHTLRDLVADSCELGEQSKVLVLLDSGVAEANPGLTDKIFRYFTVPLTHSTSLLNQWLSKGESPVRTTGPSSRKSGRR